MNEVRPTEELPASATQPPWRHVRGMVAYGTRRVVQKLPSWASWSDTPQVKKQLIPKYPDPPAPPRGRRCPEAGWAGRNSSFFAAVQGPSGTVFLLPLWGRPELEPVTLVSFPCSVPQVARCSLLEQHGLFSAPLPTGNSSRGQAPFLPLLLRGFSQPEGSPGNAIPLPPQGSHQGAPQPEVGMQLPRQPPGPPARTHP